VLEYFIIFIFNVIIQLNTLNIVSNFVILYGMFYSLNKNVTWLAWFCAYKIAVTAFKCLSVIMPVLHLIWIYSCGCIIC